MHRPARHPSASVIRASLKAIILAVAFVLLTPVAGYTQSPDGPQTTTEKPANNIFDRYRKANPPATPPAENFSEAQSYWATAKNWLRVQQAEISRQLAALLTRFKETNDFSFALTLLVGSFLYGLVHAAGPGHGKVVVAGYVMANRQTMRRGIFLAFLSAFVQGTVAIALVGTLALLFNATGSAIRQLGFQLTQLSFLLIIALGLYLLAITLRRLSRRANPAAAHAHHHGHEHGGHKHDGHEHGESCGCGHSHMPPGEALQGKWDIAKIISLTLAVGLRPCTGALFILAFALVKGLFWVGALSVYAMAFGTAITISAATMAVVAGRQLVFFSSGNNERAIFITASFFQLAGAIAIIIFGALLLASTFGPTRPF